MAVIVAQIALRGEEPGFLVADVEDGETFRPRERGKDKGGRETGET